MLKKTERESSETFILNPFSLRNSLWGQYYDENSIADL